MSTYLVDAYIDPPSQFLSIFFFDGVGARDAFVTAAGGSGALFNVTLAFNNGFTTTVNGKIDSITSWGGVQSFTVPITANPSLPTTPYSGGTATMTLGGGGIDSSQLDVLDIFVSGGKPGGEMMFYTQAAADTAVAFLQSNTSAQFQGNIFNYDTNQFFYGTGTVQWNSSNTYSGSWGPPSSPFIVGFFSGVSLTNIVTLASTPRTRKSNDPSVIYTFGGGGGGGAPPPPPPPSNPVSISGGTTAFNKIIMSDDSTKVFALGNGVVYYSTVGQNGPTSWHQLNTNGISANNWIDGTYSEFGKVLTLQAANDNQVYYWWFGSTPNAGSFSIVSFGSIDALLPYKRVHVFTKINNQGNIFSAPQYWTVHNDRYRVGQNNGSGTEGFPTSSGMWYTNTASFASASHIFSIYANNTNSGSIKWVMVEGDENANVISYKTTTTSNPTSMSNWVTSDVISNPTALFQNRITYNTTSGNFYTQRGLRINNITSSPSHTNDWSSSYNSGSGLFVVSQFNGSSPSKELWVDMGSGLLSVSNASSHTSNDYTVACGSGGNSNSRTGITGTSTSANNYQLAYIGSVGNAVFYNPSFNKFTTIRTLWSFNPSTNIYKVVNANGSNFGSRGIHAIWYNTNTSKWYMRTIDNIFSMSTGSSAHPPAKSLEWTSVGSVANGMGNLSSTVPGLTTTHTGFNSNTITPIASQIYSVSQPFGAAIQNSFPQSGPQTVINFINKNDTNVEISDRTNINYSWNSYGNRIGVIKSYMTIGSSTFRRRVYQGASVTYSRNDTPFWNMPGAFTLNGYDTYGFRYGVDEAVFVLGAVVSNSATTDMRIQRYRATSSDTNWPTSSAQFTTNISNITLARLYDPSVNKVYAAGAYNTSTNIRVGEYNGTSIVNLSNQNYPAIMGGVEVGTLESGFTSRSSPNITQSRMIKVGDYIYHISSSRVFAYDTFINNDDTGLTDGTRWKVIHWGASSISTFNIRFSSTGGSVIDLKGHIATKPDGSVSLFKFPFGASNNGGDFRYSIDGYSMKPLNLRLFNGCPDLSSTTADHTCTSDVVWSTAHEAFILIKQGVIWASTDGINWYPKKIQSLYSNLAFIDTLHLINTDTKLISVVNAHQNNGFYIYESTS